MRRLFADKLADVEKACINALDRMCCWATESDYSEYSFSLKGFSDVYNMGYDYIAYNTSNFKWVFVNQDGNYFDLQSVDLRTIADMVDWIELTYSPDHRCGHRL